DLRSAASALTAMLHHGATPPDGKSRWRAKRASAAMLRNATGARQLQRLVRRRPMDCDGTGSEWKTGWLLDGVELGWLQRRRREIDGEIRLELHHEVTSEEAGPEPPRWELPSGGLIADRATAALDDEAV